MFLNYFCCFNGSFWKQRFQRRLVSSPVNVRTPIPPRNASIMFWEAWVASTISNFPSCMLIGLKHELSSAQRNNVVTEQNEKVEVPWAEDRFQSFVHQLTKNIDTVAAAMNTTRTQPRGGARRARRQAQKGRSGCVKV